MNKVYFAFIYINFFFHFFFNFILSPMPPNSLYFQSFVNILQKAMLRITVTIQNSRFLRLFWIRKRVRIYFFLFKSKRKCLLFWIMNCCYCRICVFKWMPRSILVRLNNFFVRKNGLCYDFFFEKYEKCQHKKNIANVLTH